VSVTILVVPLCDSSVLHHHLMMHCCMTLHHLELIRLSLSIRCRSSRVRNQWYPRYMITTSVHPILTPRNHCRILRLIALIVVWMLILLIRNILLWIAIWVIEILHGPASFPRAYDHLRGFFKRTFDLNFAVRWMQRVSLRGSCNLFQALWKHTFSIILLKRVKQGLSWITNLI
jgi:hypothetical protein